VTAGGEQDQWRGLHPSARTVWGMAGALPAGLAAVGGGVGVAVTGMPVWLILTALAALAGAVWWLVIGRRWRAWGYAERERDLLIRRGVLVRHLTIVPYGRMQFVDVKQGPLARALGVSTVQLHTAAAATDARIPFVADSEAARLRDRLTALGEAHAAGL
jgi:uncharacterized protein